MFLIPSRILSRSNCILILVMSNLANSAPLRSRKRSPNEGEQGFSVSPRILEIQLPLRIASKEDMVAWSKYVMTLVASKINFTTTTLKDALVGTQHEKPARVILGDNSGSKLKETTRKASPGEKRSGVNYPARRLKEPYVQRADDKVVAYPLPVGEMKFTASNLQNPFDLPTPSINGPSADQQLYHGHYANFNRENPFQQDEAEIFGNADVLAQPPAATYLPLPMRMTDIIKHRTTVDRNVSGIEEPVKLQTTKNSLNLRIKAFNDELERLLPIAVKDELARKNLSNGESLLTLPFQAVITFTGQLPSATQSKDYFTIRTRDPSDEFRSSFKKNYTLTNESGQVNVILDDVAPDTNKKKIRKNKEEEEEDEEEKERERETQKNEKKKKGAKQQKSKKRQPFIFGDLLRMLGILRKLPKNTTEVNVAPPVLSILKGTNPQKVQVTFEEVPNRERRNETSQAQEESDDLENEKQEEEEEEEGGSIQAILDLLPLAAPILEELSDPESDINLVEVIQGAIPLLEGLSDPEEDGIDIPGVLVPLSQRLSEGPEGQGSDSGAILGPLIQLIAPLIGPLLGPLIGPLSRTSSGPNGKEGSASVITAVAGPLSQPGLYGQPSVISSLVAGITAKLSKELAASAGDSDVKSLVSAIVSGVLAGASSGSSGTSKGHKDTYYAPTTYGSHNTYANYGSTQSNIGDTFSVAIKEILGAFLKLSATSSTSSANLSGTSSSSSATLSATSSEGSQEPPKNPTYGAPTNPPYSPPSPMRPIYASPPSTNSYTTFTRRQRQQIKKF